MIYFICANPNIKQCIESDTHKLAAVVAVLSLFICVNTPRQK